MSSKQTSIFAAVSILLLASAACALPNTAPKASSTPGSSSALALAATQTALAALPSPSSSPEPVQSPSETPPPLSTETPTETPLPVGVFPTDTPTATPETIWAEVMKTTNCRTGPGGMYDLVTTFEAGARLQVAARDLGGGFIAVKNPDKPEEECYVLVNNVKLSGEIAFLPQYTPLASPTASPNLKVTFKKFDLCKGDVLAQFVVENIGSVPFRSAYIKVTNLKTGQSAEQAVNAFDLTVGCIIAKNIAPLDPGATGYLSSPVFKNDPRGNKLRAIIHACTEKSLKGTCVDVVVEIQP
jgi:hypothetical protein